MSSGFYTDPYKQFLAKIFMLRTHLDAVESTLLATSRIPASSGHNLHKGTPRESFIKNFLNSHLSERVAVGTGEIIDADSKPGEKRNQLDIVIYKRDYPKIDFGGGISGFLVESVVAIIEVKSTLTKDELRSSFVAAQNVKRLKNNEVKSFHVGYQPPSIMSYVVAYDGPASMNRVYEWKNEITTELALIYPEMEPSLAARARIASPSIDAAFILGKGFLYYDNAPLGFLSDEERKENPSIKWLFGDNSNGNLLLLFMHLCQIVGGMSANILNPIPYLKNAGGYEVNRGL